MKQADRFSAHSNQSGQGWGLSDHRRQVCFLSLIVTGFGLLHEIPLRPPFRRDGYVIRLTSPCHESAVLQCQFLLKPPQSKHPLRMKSFDLSDAHAGKCTGIILRFASPRAFHELSMQELRNSRDGADRGWKFDAREVHPIRVECLDSVKAGRASIAALLRVTGG
jgi:hypothetical protein